MIITSLVAISFIIGFGVGIFVSNSQIEEQICEYFVWEKEEKLCVSEKLKGHIEKLEEGIVDRLKSKRGVKQQ